MTLLTRVEMVGRHMARKYLPRRSPSGLGHDPYDKGACEARAGKLLDELHHETGLAPIEICRRLLVISENSYPTEALADEYFSNLEIVLGDTPRLEAPGQLVIGLGPGRCGSTSLSAMLGTVENSCCTHETPPPIFWRPQREQIDFHVRRFKTLANYYSVVSDVSHWWLNAIERVFDQIPEAKAIGLIRDPDDCARSFMPVQGFGRGSFNPWATPGNGIWRAGLWDPTYPSYSAPSYASRSPDRAKLELVTRYVRGYNSQLESLALNAPNRVRLVRTEELSRDTVQEEIFQVARARGKTSGWRLNVKTTTDGKMNQIKF